MSQCLFNSNKTTIHPLFSPVRKSIRDRLGPVGGGSGGSPGHREAVKDRLGRKGSKTVTTSLSVER